MSFFPPELEDLVIRHLKGQTSTLASCGLVNKGWMEMSRAYLFGAVTLRDHNYDEFLRLVAKDTNTFVHNVKSVTVSRRETDIDGDTFFTELVPQLGVLDALLRLRVFYLPWIGVSRTSIDTFASVFRGLVHLVLSHTNFASPYDLVSLLGRLTALEQVAVHGTFLHDAPREGDPGHASSLTKAAILGPAPPPNLAVVRLKIRSNTGDPFTYIALWLAARPPPLRVFEAGLLWPDSIPAIGFLCGTMGAGLRELDLQLLNHVTANDIQNHLKLSENPNLEHLTLHIGLRRFHAPSTRPHAPWAVLAALPANEHTSLKSLTLVLLIDYIYMFDSLDWPHLNAALRPHTRLKALNFLVHCHNTISDQEQMVGPELRKRVADDVKARVEIGVEVVYTSRAFTHLEVISRR
ncbi:hypothetical protein C8F01DRAFT_1254914 [Mycena amicta]|nr:hypothetical protein C8F01DRAFT_1254914 [Mycena amicta]